MSDYPAKHHHIILKWRRIMLTTRAYGAYHRLSLHEVGKSWGEGEWTGRDLWT